MKIAVVGMGYVGLSNAVLLAAQHQVVLLDIVPEKVTALKAKRSPIQDAAIEQALASEPLDLTATLDAREAFAGAQYVIVATSTDYDEATATFNTRAVESVIAQARELAPEAVIIVRSTLPMGFTESQRALHNTDAIIFMPEFLREGRALYDNRNPSRIVVGDTSACGQDIAVLFAAAAHAENVPILLTDSTEAEAIKLFANTYLAMRVAFFNELDSFAAARGLNARQIIEGVSLDPRIGTHYNNPSFGYGGYCLPKDTKQMVSQFNGIPQELMTAIVESNATRMDFIAQDILQKKPKSVGIYRLIMKAGSDNFREASALGIIERLKKAGVHIVIYEPLLPLSDTQYGEVMHDLAAFKNTADVIVANRAAAELTDAAAKLYTRDVYGRD